MERIENIVPPAILVLSQSAFVTAKKIQDHYPHSTVYSLSGRVAENKNEYKNFSEFIQKQYTAGIPIIALCAAGIVIRSLSSVLDYQETSPPVIAVAGDGSCVVPLLGITNGANSLAIKLGEILHCQAAITTSGELCFGINLLCPPDDLCLINHKNGKKFIAALLNGATVRFEGQHFWFSGAHLPVSDHADLVIRILSHTDRPITVRENELVYLQIPSSTRGRISIIGLGPGTQGFRTFSAQQALNNADDILGYDFYIDFAGPFSKSQTVHKSNNREELERARHALALAAQGHHAALVSSGDPGIYAMAAAVLEAWEQDTEAQFDDIEIVIEPGISAAFAAAACLGAPLGHDFSVISLSDNLKPWEMIEKRIRFSSRADMVLALYNPVSKTRNIQLRKAIRILQEERLPNTIIALAHDVARKNEILKITTLEQLKFDEITSRTVILVGSSQTRRFKKNGRDWIYTPRSYYKV